MGTSPQTNRSPVKEERKEAHQTQEQETMPEEMFYDKNLKRWVLRGKIYEDEEDKKAKQATTTAPIKPPPKITKPQMPPNQNYSSVPKTSQTIIEQPINPNLTQYSTNPTNNVEQTTPQISQPLKQNLPPSKNVINNPFGNTAIKKEPQKMPQKPNLTNRYTNTFDK